MDSIIVALVSFFLLEPLKAEMANRLEVAGAPQSLVAELTACAGTAMPLVVERATADPWWAATKTISIWVGSIRPEALIVEVAPGCSRAVESTRPFLAKGEA